MFSYNLEKGGSVLKGESCSIWESSALNWNCMFVVSLLYSI